MKTLLTTLFVFFAFIGQSQTLVSISPATGAAGNSVNITIQGNGTAFTNSSIFILSSGTSILTVSNIVAVSATSVQATVSIPANAVSGSYTLTTLAGFTPIQLPNAFTVTGGGVGTSIQSIDPDKGSQGQLVAIAVSGAHTRFTQSTNTTAVLMQGLGTSITAFDTEAINDTTLICSFEIPFGATLGTYSLLLTTSNDGILTKPNAFTVNLKRETFFSPSQGIMGETLDVTIFCESAFPETTGIVVDIFQSEKVFLIVNSTTIVNDSTLLCNITIPTDALFGSYDVYINYGDRYEFVWQSFIVNRDPATMPRIVSVSPAKARRGEELDITISGTNTLFAQASERYMALFGQDEYVEPISFKTINDSVLVAHFEIPADLPPGLYDLYVTTDMDGYMELLQSFTITKATAVDEENKILEQLIVYPNPVKNELTFESDQQVKSILITDLTGKQITIPLDNIRHYSNAYTVDIERCQISKGIYFIRVESDQGIQYQKFIVE